MYVSMFTCSWIKLWSTFEVGISSEYVPHPSFNATEKIKKVSRTSSTLGGDVHWYHPIDLLLCHIINTWNQSDWCFAPAMKRIPLQLFKSKCQQFTTLKKKNIGEVEEHAHMHHRSSLIKAWTCHRMGISNRICLIRIRTTQISLG